MLSADFGHLDRDTRMIDSGAAEWIHIDVMDGVFVPNISFGFPVMKAIRKASPKFMDVHLMIVEPEKYLKRFVEAGADLVTFHYEATSNPREAIRIIKEAGAKAGISVKPATPVDVLAELLPELDLVLIMSVEPGFGGQSFIEGSWDKVRTLRRMIDEGGYSTLIEIDGGVSAANSAELFAAGCDALVAGSAVFGAPDPNAEIEKMLGL
jgi:ribulose-phosphate 3-epimerase